MTKPKRKRSASATIDAELRRLSRLKRGPGHPLTPEDVRRTRLLARGIVARAITEALAGVPCFCTPERPELERPEWCVRHHVLDRLGPTPIDTLAVEVLSLDLGLTPPPTPPEVPA